MIDHIVLSSAGPNGLIQIGILSHIIEINLIDPNNLKSIYASSAGSILGLLLCLKIPIQEIIEYFIERPLDKWFKLDMSFIATKGLVSSDCFRQLLIPFFKAYDIPITLSMKELYERTNIDFHIFTTSVREMISVDLNHLTFPDLSVVTAVSMSSSIPFLITPIHYENEYYMDGGILKHCPVPEVDPDTLLVILIDFKPELDLSSTMQFIQHIFLKSYDIISTNTSLPTCKYLFRYNSTSLSITPAALERFLVDKTFRFELIEIGKNLSIDFIKKIET